MRTREQVIEAMKNCYQTKGQSIYEHGESVRYYSNCLISYISNDISSDL